MEWDVIKGGLTNLLALLGWIGAVSGMAYVTSWRASSRTRMISMSLCFMSQAVALQTPRLRLSSGEGGDVFLGLREQVHGKEPARQGQPDRLEDCAADHAALVPAAGALKVQPPLTVKRTVLRAASRRVGKTIRSARFDPRRPALFIATVKLHKLDHRKSRLKLHFVHRHGSHLLYW